MALGPLLPGSGGFGAPAPTQPSSAPPGGPVASGAAPLTPRGTNGPRGEGLGNPHMGARAQHTGGNTLDRMMGQYGKSPTGVGVSPIRGTGIGKPGRSPIKTHPKYSPEGGPGIEGELGGHGSETSYPTAPAGDNI